MQLGQTERDRPFEEMGQQTPSGTGRKEGENLVWFSKAFKGKTVLCCLFKAPEVFKVISVLVGNAVQQDQTRSMMKMELISTLCIWGEMSALAKYTPPWSLNLSTGWQLHVVGVCVRVNP